MSIHNVRHMQWDWLERPQYVYVGRFYMPKRIPYGRDTYDLEGYYGNPYWLHERRSRSEACSQYAEWAKNRVMQNAEFAVRVLNLYNKSLVCWCYPEQCHANVLEDMANRFAQLCRDNGINEQYANRNEHDHERYYDQNQFLELLGHKPLCTG